MSTKCTIAHSNKPESDFHFYRECFDDDHVYLELCGAEVEYEAGPDRVMVRIPVEIWEVIRQLAAIQTKYADWTDEQIDAEAKQTIDQLIDDYHAEEPGLRRRWFRLAGAEKPHKEQVAAERHRLFQIRDKHTERKRRIDALLEGDPKEAVEIFDVVE